MNSDAPTWFTVAGVTLLVAAVWIEFVPFIGLPAPGWPLLLGFFAFLCFAAGAAIKATERRR